MPFQVLSEALIARSDVSAELESVLLTLRQPSADGDRSESAEWAASTIRRLRGVQLGEELASRVIELPHRGGRGDGGKTQRRTQPAKARLADGAGSKSAADYNVVLPPPPCVQAAAESAVVPAASRELVASLARAAKGSVASASGDRTSSRALKVDATSKSEQGLGARDRALGRRATIASDQGHGRACHAQANSQAETGQKSAVQARPTRSVAVSGSCAGKGREGRGGDGAPAVET